MENGLKALGKSVPQNRLENAYKCVKEIIPNIDSKTAMSIVNKASELIKRDEPYGIVGAAINEDKDLDRIDLIGRYRLLATLLSD